MINYTKKNVNLLAFIITAIIFIFLQILNSIFFSQTQKRFSENLVYSKVVPNYSNNVKNFICTNNLDYINIQNSNIYQNGIMQNMSKIKKTALIVKEKDDSVIQNENSETENEKTQIEKQETEQTDELKKTQRQYIEENKQIKWRIQIPKLNLDVHIQEGTTTAILLTSVGHFEETSKWKGNVGLAAHNRGYNCNFFQEIKTLVEGDEIIYTTTNGKKVYKVQINKIISETDWSYLETTKDNRITLITCEENRKEYRRCVQAVEVANYKK